MSMAWEGQDVDCGAVGGVVGGAVGVGASGAGVNVEFIATLPDLCRRHGYVEFALGPDLAARFRSLVECGPRDHRTMCDGAP